VVGSQGFQPCSKSPKEFRVYSAVPSHSANCPLAEHAGIEPAPVLPVASLAGRWLTICLVFRGTGARIRTAKTGFGDQPPHHRQPRYIWRKSEESNPDVSPSPGFQDQLPTVQQTLPMSKNLVAEERFELSCPKALVPKTSVYAFHHSATGPLARSRTVNIRFAGEPLTAQDRVAITDNNWMMN
jgi:hypothetical protein